MRIVTTFLFNQYIPFPRKKKIPAVVAQPDLISDANRLNTIARPAHASRSEQGPRARILLQPGAPSVSGPGAAALLALPQGRA
jgi:hypothetical protein